MMTNAEKFVHLFGLYATELWSKSEKDFLVWLNAEYENVPDTNVGELISRTAAIDAVCAVCGDDCDKSEFVYNAPQDEQVILCPEHYCLCILPSAQPERKRGKWIDYSDEGYVECPFCHSATNCDGNKDELHYCFSCGAELRGGEK